MHEKTRRVLTGVAALAAAGGVTAGIAGAAKDDKTTGDRGGMPFGRGHDEAALTGETKEQAEAAALEAVPGGTVLRSEEDAHPEGPQAGTAKYEVHMTDADGAPVDVYLDENFAVVAQRAGRPPGAVGGDGLPGRHGGPGRHHHGTPLTGEAKEKAEAAAAAELPGAEVRESFASAVPGVEGAKYAVAVEKADGAHALVVLDEVYAVLKVVDAPAFGRGPHPRPEPLIGETAAKAREAAKAAVPKASVRAAFAAPEGADEAYVVIMERRNRRHVIVLLDEGFGVVRKLSRPRFGGPGPGPGGPGHHGGPPPGMPA